MIFSLRKATMQDVPVLGTLIAESARGLAREDYTTEQIEAALGSAWGIDTELIHDGSYYVAEVGKEIVGCGGWSRRKTLFGGDKQAGRQSEILNPHLDAARIRAFFIHPDWARKGIGLSILQKCEEEAMVYGFRRCELMATLPGHRLYRSLGYSGDERVTYQLGNGVNIDFIPMKKNLL